MAHFHKPRCGSLAYYPRKKAKRIYPSVTAWPRSNEARLLGFPVYKAGMEHVMIKDTRKNSLTHNMEIQLPVTVLEAPKIVLAGFRAYKSTVYGLKAFSEIWNGNPSKDLGRKMVLAKEYNADKSMKKIEGALKDIYCFRAIVHTQPRSIKLKKTPEVMELGMGGKAAEQFSWLKEHLGKEVSVSDVFNVGELIDAISVTTGKGTQGPVRRFNVKIQNMKAQRAGRARHVGSVGGWHPARVRWTVPMAGQTGYQTRTDYNKQIIKMGDDGKEVSPISGFRKYGIVSSYVLVSGSVPGPVKRMINLRKAIRPHGKQLPSFEVEQIVR